MKIVALSQRVDVIASYGERRDALDQQWAEFIHACGGLPLLIPNSPKIADALLTQYSPDLIVLTGGNNLASYAGDAPERDDTERALLDFGLKNNIPVIGICRGMQFIQDHFGVPLQPVEGHVCREQTISVDGERRTVNSYHNLGTTITTDELEVTARSDDEVIKAVRHRTLALWGMMWHPERMVPFTTADIEFFRERLGD